MTYFNFLGIILITLMSVISHTESLAKEQNEENIDIKINGKKCTQIKDGDLISLSLPEHYKTEDIESINGILILNKQIIKNTNIFYLRNLIALLLTSPKYFSVIFHTHTTAFLEDLTGEILKKRYVLTTVIFHVYLVLQIKKKTISAIFAQNLLILKFCHLLQF